MFQFQEQEKKRYTQEQQRFETKHVKQLEELRATAEGTVRYVSHRIILFFRRDVQLRN